ncbi:MAG: hypothetical protein FWD53_11640 [Phycisphaerales bacterium]|nr:hypothetical protein [Phycisphaerales bacterium]
MQSSPVACYYCGKSLQISDSTRFVTCQHCNAQLEIKRSDSASELGRLDREWADRYRGRNGAHAPPTATAGYLMIFGVGGASLIGTLIAIGIGILFSFSFAMFDAPWPFWAVLWLFPLFGILFIVLAFTSGIKTLNAAAKYPEELRQYQLRREQLLAQIAQKTTS